MAEAKRKRSNAKPPKIGRGARDFLRALDERAEHEAGRARSDTRPRLAKVRSAAGGNIEAKMVGSGIVLDDDDLQLSQSVAQYEANTGIVAGDLLVCLPYGGDYIVVDVVSSTALGRATIGQSTPTVADVSAKLNALIDALVQAEIIRG